MCCSVLQRAVCCSVSQRAVCCSVLQHVAMCCSLLQWHVQVLWHVEALLKALLSCVMIGVLQVVGAVQASRSWTLNQCGAV